jgi:hypothetical protein
MSYNNGPKIVTDGLVMYLDAANIKSFRGEPTTNIVQPAWSSWGIDGSGQGSVGTRTIYSDYYCRIVDSAANTRQSIWAYNASPSTTYTFSVKYRKIAGTPTLRFQIQPYAGATYQSSVFPTTTQIGIIDTDDWQTATYSVTGNASTDRFLWFMQDGDDYTTYTHTFELKEAQVEAKTYYTPFVSGSRGTSVATGGGLYDLTRGGNDGTLTNGPTYTSSFGGSIVFDGTNDYISIPNTAALNPANITVSAWVNRTSTVNYAHFVGLPVSNTSWTSPYMSYGIEYIGTSDTISLVLGFSDNSFAYTNATAFGNNQWFQFIGTYDGTNVKVYINGAIQTTRAETKTMATSSANFYIGSNNTSTGYPLNGKIGSVQLYNRALSASEVLRCFNATKGRFGIK